MDIDMMDVLGMLFTEEEIKTKRIAKKIDLLCDEDLIMCYECPYSKGSRCTIKEYLKGAN